MSQTINGVDSSSNLRSANNTLSQYVETMLHHDKRFVGMSRYVFNINFYWTEAIETACAGHGFIFFNPNFWDKLSEQKKKTVIAHEIWHLILNHLERGEGLDQDIYNKAADHVINNNLMDEGFVMGPNEDFGGILPCCDPQYRYMSSEQVYAKIYEEAKKNPESGAGNGVSGTPTKDQIEDLVQEALNGTGKDLQQQIEENEEKRQKATEESQAPGSQTGNSHILIQTEAKQVVIKEASYEEIFEDFLTDPLSGGKRTFMRPSRRQVKGGLRMKGKFPKRGRKNRLTHLIYALDVSGSISHEMRTQFLRSAKTLKEKLNPALMTVILWDTQIKFEKIYREDEKLDNITINAGGGTSLNPVYKRVEQLNPEALVIFTDLVVNIPPKPNWKTIWFVPNGNIYDAYLQQVTYGDVYRVPEN